MAAFIADGTRGRLYPLGTIIEQAKLVQIAKPHVCKGCGRTLRARSAAWMRKVRARRFTYYGQRCCQSLIVSPVITPKENA